MYTAASRVCTGDPARPSQRSVLRCHLSAHRNSYRTAGPLTAVRTRAYSCSSGRLSRTRTTVLPYVRLYGSTAVPVLYLGRVLYVQPSSRREPGQRGLQVPVASGLRAQGTYLGTAVRMISPVLGQIAEWACTEHRACLPACQAAPSLPDRTHETLTSELTSKTPSHLLPL